MSAEPFRAAHELAPERTADAIRTAIDEASALTPSRVTSIVLTKLDEARLWLAEVPT